MKFIPLIISFLFTLSCQKEIPPATDLYPLQSWEFIKIEPGSGEIYLAFEGIRDVRLIEIDRLLEVDESIEVEIGCNQFNLTEQQTHPDESNIRFCIIKTQLNSPIYIAFE